MIHYNSKKHHDIIVNELKRCFQEETEVGRPISPSKKNGVHYIIVNHHTYSIDEETLLQLEHEAHHQWMEDTRIKFTEELGVSTDDVENLVKYTYFIKSFSFSDLPSVRASLFYPLRKERELDIGDEALKIPLGITSCSYYKKE